MTDLRTTAQQALEAKQTPLIELLERIPQDARLVVEHDQFSSSYHPVGRLCHEAAAALRAALAEEALQRLTDVQQEMERNFCPRCGKRTNDIHTCTPPDSKHATIKQRKPLTEEEIKECERQAMVNGSLPFEQRVFFARAIERAHGIGGKDE